VVDNDNKVPANVQLFHSMQTVLGRQIQSHERDHGLSSMFAFDPNISLIDSRISSSLKTSGGTSAT
jgi:hypothetical protein